MFASIRAQPAVSIDEGMNMDRAMVQICRLFKEVWPVLLPVLQVIDQILKLRLDLMPRYANIQIDAARLSRPVPNVVEHFGVKLEQPVQIERRQAAA